MLISRNVRNSDYKFVNRWYINFNLNVSKMKKTFLSLGFVLISSFAMASTIEVKEEKENPCEVAAYVAVTLAEEEYQNETGECLDSWVYNYIYFNALENC
jgi:hypothetical protein